MAACYNYGGKSSCKMSNNSGLVCSVISTMAGNVHFFLDNVKTSTIRSIRWSTLIIHPAFLSVCFFGSFLFQTIFTLRKTEEGSEQAEKYFCQLWWSWSLRSLHTLLKQMHNIDKIVFFQVAILDYFDLVDRSKQLYHNDLELHLHYFCTALSTSRVWFLFNFIFTVKLCNFCVQKT